MTTAPIFEGVADVEAQAQRMRAFHLTGATLAGRVPSAKRF